MMEVPRSNRVSNRRPPEDASYQPSNPLNNDEDATENHSEVLFDSEDEEMLRYDESTTEDHPEALFDSGDEEMLGYEEIVVAGHIMMVEKRAPMPTHHEFYMDLFYGTAVLTRPNASLEFKEACLAAQNIRGQNEVPRQPTKVHWDYVLDEAKVVRDAMKERRRAFMKVAKKAAEKAQEGWVNGKQRKCGSSSAWARFFPTFAISIDPEEARKAEGRKDTKAAERAVREANGAELPVILVTTPTPRGSGQLEKPVRGRPGGLLGPDDAKNRRARTQQ